MRYLITFSCYGGRLHGDEAGSVDARHNLPGTPLLNPDPQRASEERHKMHQASYSLSHSRRAVVLDALREVCHSRGWQMLACHVRTTHAHIVVESEARPERVMNDFKAYASRALSRFKPELADSRRWARHGSTRWLWKDQDVREAVRYVVERQGEPMAVYVAESP